MGPASDMLIHEMPDGQQMKIHKVTNSVTDHQKCSADTDSLVSRPVRVGKRRRTQLDEMQLDVDEPQHGKLVKEQERRHANNARER